MFIFNDFTYYAKSTGQLETRANYAGIFAMFENGAQLLLINIQNYERLSEEFEIHDDIILPPQIYSFSNWYAEYNSDKSRMISGGLSLIRGQFFNGEINSVGLKANLKAGSRLTLNLVYDYNDVELDQGSFNTSVVGARLTWTFTPRLFIKPYLQWNSEGKTLLLNILFNYIHTAGSDLFIVYNEEQEAGSVRNRSLLAKFTYLLNF